MSVIRFYSDKDKDKYKYLTNFYDRKQSNDPDFRLVIDEIDFSSSEHAYQAIKFVTEDYDTNELQQKYFRIIAKQSTPYKAKILGHQQISGGRYEWENELMDIAYKYKNKGVICSPDWEDIKVGAMELIVREKFNQNPHLKKKFMEDTSVDDTIIEASNYDYFWGEGKNRSGRNELGKIMMRLRKEFEDELKSDGSETDELESYDIIELDNGLILVNNFITEDTEDKLLDFLEDEDWVNVSGSNREVIHYGYKYPYSGKGYLEKTTKIPRIIRKLIKLMNDIPQLEDFHPNQVIVNKYEPGQGIGAHTDHEKFFKDKIVSISILSGIAIKFQHKYDSSKTNEIYADKNSLYAMTGESRYDYTHQIAKRNSDMINGKRVKRDMRISITFREVNKRYVK